MQLKNATFYENVCLELFRPAISFWGTWNHWFAEFALSYLNMLLKINPISVVEDHLHTVTEGYDGHEVLIIDKHKLDVFYHYLGIWVQRYVKSSLNKTITIANSILFSLQIQTMLMHLQESENRRTICLGCSRCGKPLCQSFEEYKKLPTTCQYKHVISTFGGQWYEKRYLEPWRTWTIITIRSQSIHATISFICW